MWRGILHEQFFTYKGIFPPQYARSKGNECVWKWRTGRSDNLCIMYRKIVSGEGYAYRIMICTVVGILKGYDQLIT